MSLDTADKLQLYATRILRLSLVVAIVVAGFNQRFALVFATVLILIATFFPLFVERKYKVQLPIEFQVVIIGFIYASLFLGEVQGYYTRFWWWDLLLHASAAMALGLFGFLALYVLYYQNRKTVKPLWIAVFAFSFALAIGSIWEMFEFGMDQLFGFNMQKSGLTDTMWDLIVDALGALVTSIVGFFYIKGKPVPLFRRFVLKFAKENPTLFKD